jgi:hypothetical protein
MSSFRSKFDFRQPQATAAPLAQPGMNKGGPGLESDRTMLSSRAARVSIAVERSSLNVTNDRGGLVRVRASGDAVLATDQRRQRAEGLGEREDLSAGLPIHWL